jgi:hypothetical protein
MKIQDIFTFELTNDMFINPNSDAFAQARCHLITYFLKSHVIKNSYRNKMKKDYVDALVEHVINSALNDIF